MQCPACGLDNEDDRHFCASCAEELVPGAAAQIEPPRARERTARRLRGAAGAGRRAWAGIAGAMGRAGVALRDRQRWALRARYAALVLAAVVPGLGHLILGERRAGRRLLAAFAVALVMVLVLVGTSLSFLMGVAVFSLVFGSVLDISRRDPATGQRQVANWGHVFLALAVTLGCYAGVAALLNATSWERVTMRTSVVRLAPPISTWEPRPGMITVFERGDRILFLPSAYRRAAPVRGDIVRARMGGPRVPQLQRILAVPGDEIALRSGHLFVNDRELPVAAYPLQAIQPEVEIRLFEGSRRLGEGQYAVWGERNAFGVGPVIVWRGAILSKAWLVYGPITRRRVINHRDPAGRAVPEPERRRNYGPEDD